MQCLRTLNASFFSTVTDMAGLGILRKRKSCISQHMSLLFQPFTCSHALASRACEARHHLVEVAPAACLVAEAECALRAQLNHEHWLLVVCFTVMMSHKVAALRIKTQPSLCPLAFVHMSDHSHKPAQDCSDSLVTQAGGCSGKHDLPEL